MRLLREVIPMLADRGILDVVPQSGTYVRAIPPAVPFDSGSPAASGAAAGVRTIRIYCQEVDRYSGDTWRRLIASFERTRQETRVEIGLGWNGQDGIGDADMLYGEILTLQHRREEGRRFAVWFDPAQTTGRFLGPAERFLRRNSGGQLHPVAAHTHALFVNRRLAADVGLAIGSLDAAPLSWIKQAMAAKADGMLPEPAMGVFADNYMAVMALLGCGQAPFAEQRDEVRRFAELAQQCPDPVLVLPSDIPRGIAGAPAVELLMRRPALFALCPFWCAGVPVMAEYKVAPVALPSTAKSRLSCMAVAVLADSPHAGLAADFARFIVGAEGQRIIGKPGGILPVRLAAARRHPQFRQWRPIECSGPRNDFVLRWDSVNARRKLEEALHDLRTCRISVETCIKRLEPLWKIA
ncbi:MAG: hypothetical protein A3K18_28505 [Lentisphaerae bacterium RIFOXYA12_64_32]|nr:MAG: hypothetical protein A3K18_28505 [Lentisphaerae bacterium RIFOXYA12_64_32]